MTAGTETRFPFANPLTAQNDSGASSSPAQVSVPPLQACWVRTPARRGLYPAGPSCRPRPQISPSPVKEVALDAGIPVFQPANFKSADVAVLESLHADLMIVVAYGLLLPRRVLDAPRLGCVNIHASVLPRWRGAAPVNAPCWPGCDLRRDHHAHGGRAGYRADVPDREVSLASDETGSLHDRLSTSVPARIDEGAAGYLDGTLVAEPQDDEPVLLCKSSTNPRPRSTGRARQWT